MFDNIIDSPVFGVNNFNLRTIDRKTGKAVLQRVLLTGR